MATGYLGLRARAARREQSPCHNRNPHLSQHDVASTASLTFCYPTLGEAETTAAVNASFVTAARLLRIAPRATQDSE